MPMSLPPHQTRSKKLRIRENLANRRNYSSSSWEQKFRNHTGKNHNRFQIILLLQGSVVTSIIPWIIFFAGYGFLISWLESHEKYFSLPQISGAVPSLILSFNLILSLLLIFRTNAANDRYWEGRKLWGALVNAVRNLSRNIYLIIETKSETDKLEKEITQKLVIAFAMAMKLHLRQEILNKELAILMSPSNYARLESTNHPPLEIALWIGEYLQESYNRNLVNVYQLNTLHKLVDELVNILGGCERILKTPAPLAYSIFLKQLLVIYCLIFPVGLVNSLNWWTAPIMALLSLILFGIEEIGSELENPFGRDPNDLPLDRICNTISGNIGDLIATNANNHN
jgi:ion channel-forming bestrophin family protein